jgi:hypothetical protein
MASTASTGHGKEAWGRGGLLGEPVEVRVELADVVALTHPDRAERPVLLRHPHGPIIADVYYVPVA